MRRARLEGKTLASRDAAGTRRRIKSVPVRLTAAATIERAISTAGGVAFEELDASFMLRRSRACSSPGEMLDWEAPTGGYLLQGCVSTGAAAARGALEWLDAAPDD